MTSRRSSLGTVRILATFALLAMAGATLAAGCGLATQGIPGGSGGGEAGEKCSKDEQCNDDNECTTDACSGEGLCKHAAVDDGPAPDGEQTAGDCKTVRCTGGKRSVDDDDTDVPND